MHYRSNKQKNTYIKENCQGRCVIKCFPSILLKSNSFRMVISASSSSFFTSHIQKQLLSLLNFSVISSFHFKSLTVISGHLSEDLKIFPSFPSWRGSVDLIEISKHVYIQLPLNQYISNGTLIFAFLYSYSWIDISIIGW